MNPEWNEGEVRWIVKQIVIIYIDEDKKINDIVH